METVVEYMFLISVSLLDAISSNIHSVAHKKSCALLTDLDYIRSNLKESITSSIIGQTLSH